VGIVIFPFVGTIAGFPEYKERLDGGMVYDSIPFGDGQ
jgi:hypothetical protein